MTSTRFAAALAALAGLASLGGCAYEGPAGNGNAVRAIMASQIIPPQPHPDTGTDGAAAAAAYANYKQSYASPTAQGDSGLVRR
jgi:hypothetical protein